VKYKITEEQLEKIYRALNKGQRVELIPLKDYIKVLIIQRTEAK
jgi:hypothetical protein